MSLLHRQSPSNSRMAMASPRLPSYDVKIVGGKKIIIWNNQDQDDSEHKSEENDDLSEGGRIPVEKIYEPEEETFSSATRPATSTVYKKPHNVPAGWGFRSVQVWMCVVGSI